MTYVRLVVALLLGVACTGAAAQRETHGSGDAYAERGVALAWAVLRGASDADASVVIRIVADEALYPRIAVEGINPFTKAEHALQIPKRAHGAVDVQVPRAHFGEFPRTEVRLYDAVSGAPALTVFYLGVPDTTPEFADRAKLDAYLSDRIVRAREQAAKGGS